MNTKLNFFILSLLAMLSVNAQNTLSLEEATEIMLQHNYDIQVANTQTEIAANNASVLNSGYLPTVTGTANASLSYFEGENRTVQGDRAFDPAESYNYGASVSLNYTVFNGSRRFNLKSFQEQFKLSFLQAKQVIELTSLQFAETYYQYAQLQEQLVNQTALLEVSKNRLKRAKSASEYGQNTSLEVLNAEVDVNNDSLSILNTLQTLENTKRNLNLMMGRDLNTNISVELSITETELPSKEELVSKALEYNTQIKISESTLKNSEFALQAAKGNWFPQVNFSAIYNYSGSENPNGAFLTGSYNMGPQANISLSWNIFDGGRTLTTVKNNRIAIRQQELQQQQTIEEIKRDILNAYTNYTTTKFVLRNQETALKTAELNFQRTEAQFKQGLITSIEFRQAQINQLNAQLSLSQAKYNLKLAELELLQISGGL